MTLFLLPSSHEMEKGVPTTAPPASRPTTKPCQYGGNKASLHLKSSMALVILGGVASAEKPKTHETYLGQRKDSLVLWKGTTQPHKGVNSSYQGNLVATWTLYIHKVRIRTLNKLFLFMFVLFQGFSSKSCQRQADPFASPAHADLLIVPFFQGVIYLFLL